jgi:DNA replication protein DnaC
MSLEALCRDLRIRSIYSYIQEYYPDRSDIEEIFTAACQAERDKRQANRQMRALRQAGFPTMKRFEDLDREVLPDDGQRALPALRTLGFINQKKNVILIGNAGTGKTHLAIGTGVLACEAGYRVSFRTAAGLINEMVEARRENRLTPYLRQFKKIDLLILDELGYLTFDIIAAELLFQVLAARYETMSTIITTNLAFSDWVKVFHDPALTGAILDRITQNAIIVNMNGRSYRREMKS